MEQDMFSNGCPGASDAAEAVINDPKLWRNGPASLIYDQLGIPEDCTNLDYSAVLEPRDCFLPPHIEAERKKQLELAVLSILPPNEQEASSDVDEWSWAIDAAQQNGFYHQQLHDSSPSPHSMTNGDTVDGSFHGSHSAAADVASGISAIIIDGNADIHNSEQNHRLKMLVSKLEETEAVTKLEQRKDFDYDNDSLYSLLSPNPKKPVGKQLSSPVKSKDTSNPENYSLVTQLQWENDIIWDIDDMTVNAKNAPLSKEKQARAGWIPTPASRRKQRELGEMMEPESGDNFRSMFSYENEDLVNGSWENDVIWNATEFRSQFPVPKLPVFDTADEDVIFQMPVDENPKDEKLPDKQRTVSLPKRQLIQPHTIKSKLILGKTGFIQSKWKREELEQQQEHREKLMGLQTKSDNSGLGPNQINDWTINITLSGNDEFYQSKETTTIKYYNCRHSRLIKDLVAPFILTHLNVDQLRNFHRPKLSDSASNPKPDRPDKDLYIFKSLAKRVKAKEDERKKSISEGHPILFDNPIDLSGRDGTIIMVENSEEYPPLLSQVGMCSQIINYYKRKSLKEEEYAPSLSHSFGETVYVSSSTYFPFLGSLESGQVLSSIRNNMYHSPIYSHEMHETDFLVIRSKVSGYLIRDMDGLFVAGQQCPLIEVPEPNSNKVKFLLKEFVQAFVYRKYLQQAPRGESGVTPKIRMDVVARHFPTLLESNIKTILRNSSEIKRIGNVTWLAMRTGFPLPSEEDLAEKITPEDICSYYSLLAAEQRLRDAGLDSMLALPDRGQDDVDGKKIKKPVSNPHSLLDISGGGGGEGSGGNKSQQQPLRSAFGEELLSAPWNTTTAFVAASKGRCLLQVTGPADPTGCGEGYSYARVAKRGPNTGGTEIIPQYSGRGRPRKYPLKTGGTDADLRKLSAKTAKDLLKRVGVPDKEIQKLSRWEIIDLVRTLSTEKVMQGETIDKTISKFCRWKNVHSLQMNQERYKEACQKVFELQNKVLSSAEVLSSDNEDCSDDDDTGSVVGGLNEAARRTGASEKDIERMGKRIEMILDGDGDVDRMTHEEEELERLELQKLMLGGIMAKDAEFAKRKEALEKDKELAQKSKENSQDILTDLMKNPGKVLKFTRTFKVNGDSFTRTEIVRDPVVIAAYLRIRNSKSEEFIKNFLQKAERREKKEQKQKDRLLHSQLQDIAKVEEQKVVKLQVKRKREMEDEYFPNKEAKKEAEKTLRRQRRKCGACGLPGHMKTSKECPLYNQEFIDKLIEKKEVKKQKKLCLKGAVKGGQSGQAPLPSSLSLQSLMDLEKELMISSSESDDSDDGDTSSSDEDSISTSSSEDEVDNSTERSQQSSSSQEEPIVKTDGLKMFVKKSSIQEMINQAQEQEAKEQEVARILAAMAEDAKSSSTTPPGQVARRRISSQAERENADYLVDRKYKTTAADRRSAKL